MMVLNITIIGGGLVGALCANFMAKRGYKVSLYEYRDDIRENKVSEGRSINLAISNRGRQSLAHVGLEEIVLKSAIPMKGRLLHDVSGKTKSVPYDTHTNQCIFSVGRNYLNKILLSALEKYPNVDLFFNHKLISVNFDNETATFLNTKTQKTTTVQSDSFIGADGAFSTVRRAMQQIPLFNFSQHYIEHGYLELCIPPANNKAMIPNHLHIWPRGEFMMIALPNIDQSWTVTLFMPFSRFESLNTDKKILNFFYSTFPDSVKLIGESALVHRFLNTKPSALVSIKCKPYHAGRKFMIIGDAAHAMVPFYGQGMNAGFEDCLIFDKILSECHENIENAIQLFSERRKDDAYAICDLALYNYVEMRDLVTRKSYYFRRKLDQFLFKIFPNSWVPLYNSVTFSKTSYKQCIANKMWQDKVLERITWITIICFICILTHFLLLNLSLN